MTSHDPTEDQRIAAIVREHFTAHERSQEPAIMQNTVDTNTATVREANTPEEYVASLRQQQVEMRRLSELYAESEQARIAANQQILALEEEALEIESNRARSVEEMQEIERKLGENKHQQLTPEQLIALSSDELFNIITPKRERERARALPRQRPLAVKLARRVGIVFAWLLLLVALAVVYGLAQVSVVLGQQALVEDGIAPLAAAGVAAICSLGCGFGALAVLGKLADKLCEVEP